MPASRAAKNLVYKVGNVVKRDVKRGAKVARKAYNTAVTGFAQAMFPYSKVTLVDRKGKPVETYMRKTKKK